MMQQGMAAPPQKKGMPWWGILLIVLGVLLLLGIGAVVALVFWVNSKKDAIVGDTKKTQADSIAFASTHEQKECVDEGLSRASKCDGIWCNAQQQIFVDQCLRRAKATPGFCASVPKKTEIMQAANYAVEECKRRGRHDQGCTTVMQSLPNYCANPSGPGAQ